MSFVLPRYDIWHTAHEPFADLLIERDAEGEWVKAQDAYDKLSVLEAEIHTLKVQLKDAKRARTL